jgi:hypothetical protein
VPRTIAQATASEPAAADQPATPESHSVNS